MLTEIEQLIINSTTCTRIIRKEKIQALWSNYGELSRYILAGEKYSSVIVKHIKLPAKQDHPRGWNTDTSHQRKVKSYEIEMNWYNGLGKQCDDTCKVPYLIESWKKGGETVMIMEDLNTAGFPVRKSVISYDEAKLCLQWLASFHARFLNKSPDGLWKIGSYWHLDTRKDEWNSMNDQDLKSAAVEIDRKLNECRYKTIIHGDAKLANFCFSNDGMSVSAVDFQYVGAGCGIKDVAYFLSSCFNETELELHENTLLKYYFNQLEVSLSREGLSTEIQLVIKEWKELYDFAWTDFYRFLNGWNPGHWKIHRYSKRKRDLVITILNS